MTSPSRLGSVQDAQPSEFPDTQFTRDNRSIGEIISEANSLSHEQIEQILTYQRENGVRFGEAAVALGLAKMDDVLWALSQQFHYPCASERSDSFHSELVVATNPFTEQAEAFRTIRSHVIMRMFSGEGPRKALAILSPNSGDGKTHFAANLATAFSQLPGRTLLVDGDMRTPRLHEIFNLPQRSEGLSSILSGRAASKVIQSIRDLPNLFVLPVGTIPPNPLELLERPAMELLLRELKTKFDRVIVDTPAAGFGTDGAVIAARCGAALLIARENHTRVEDLQRLTRAAQLGSTEIVGSVINRY